ncbi:MAG: DUF1877 family protein [Nannocystales bacterium]
MAVTATFLRVPDELFQRLLRSPGLARALGAEDSVMDVAEDEGLDAQLTGQLVECARSARLDLDQAWDGAARMLSAAKRGWFATDPAGALEAGKHDPQFNVSFLGVGSVAKIARALERTGPLRTASVRKALLQAPPYPFDDTTPLEDMLTYFEPRIVELRDFFQTAKARGEAVVRWIE